MFKNKDKKSTRAAGKEVSPPSQEKDATASTKNSPKDEQNKFKKQRTSFFGGQGDDDIDELNQSQVNDPFNQNS